MNFLYDLFHSRFIPQIKNSSGKAWVDIEKIQKSHIALAQEEKTCINAWAHIPWSGGSGLEKELLLIKEEDQKLEKMFISGVWPHLGPVFISALCLDGEISCRINAQNAVPFEQAVQLLNLGGIGAVLRYVKQNFELPPWQETRVITCLDYRERPPDSVPAILLRMGANRRH